jgi:bifunctional UDP-N-acetylglucosamine pyrophosphorylase/glucosamine-1-phosphate N-acetyltransferase
MKAIIMCAGEAKRMRPLTNTRPKAILPVAGKPILEHLIIEIKEAGISDIVLVVGHKAEDIRRHFGNGAEWRVNIEYVMHERPLGTADAINRAERLVGERFLAANGDIVVKRQDIAKLARRQKTTLGLIEIEGMRDTAWVETEGRQVVGINEKVEAPPTNLVNAGLYLLTSDIFRAIKETPKSPRDEYEITASLQLLIDGGHGVSFERLGFWLTASYPWDLLAMNERLLTELVPLEEGLVEANVTLKGPVSIGKGTIIRAGSYIEGPVVIGNDCQIGPNCYLRAFTSVGDECRIGAGVEVKNSIIMRGSAFPHLNYVGDSVIGEGCNFGAGTKLANVRLDKHSIRCLGVDTGRAKLGAIVGDHVQTGINAALNPGCVIGEDAVIGPGAVVVGAVRPGSRVFRR